MHFVSLILNNLLFPQTKSPRCPKGIDSRQSRGPGVWIVTLPGGKRKGDQPGREESFLLSKTYLGKAAPTAPR